MLLVKRLEVRVGDLWITVKRHGLCMGVKDHAAGSFL
jgi:hypothetical protein